MAIVKLARPSVFSEYAWSFLYGHFGYLPTETIVTWKKKIHGITEFVTKYVSDKFAPVSLQVYLVNNFNFK